MKRLLSLFAVLGLVACGTGIANANDLTNPDLDIIAVGYQANASPVSWPIVAVKSISGPYNDGADSEPWCNVLQANGYGLFFKPFSGATNANPSLNDLASVYFYQDNPSSAGTKCTLSGYASCEANFCGLAVGQSVPPAQALFNVLFLDSAGNILQSNAYDLVAAPMPQGGPGSMALLTTPQYTAPVGTVTVRAGATLIGAWSTTGAQSFFVDSFDLESVAPPGSPVVTTQPIAATIAPGGTASFTVVTTPTADTYSWTLNGTTIVNGGEFSGATTATLTVTGASTADVGHYQAKVSNAIGLNRSASVPLAFNGLNMFPTVSLKGTIGDTYEIDRGPTVSGPWTSFSTNKLTISPQYITDYTVPVAPAEFYRELFLY